MSTKFPKNYNQALAELQEGGGVSMPGVAIIMRGLPGSGKSTVAESIAPSHAIHSTDDYFYIRGKYFYQPQHLKDFHEQNLADFVESLKNGEPVVICDNTNTQYWEYSQYILAAKSYGYIVAVCQTLHPTVEECYKRNNHSVPREAIQHMLDRWEYHD